MGCKKLSYYELGGASGNLFFSLGGARKKGYAEQKKGCNVSRFGFNGQEKDNEIAGIGNSNTAMFWQYDTRLGRRWNLDPVDQIGISNYATFANNPIVNNDVLGNVVKGTTEKSASRSETLMRTSFPKDKKFDKIKALMKIGSDRLTFNKIDDKKFANATKGFSEDELAMAIGYKNQINEKTLNYVEVLKMDEEMSPLGEGLLFGRTESLYPTTGGYFDRQGGGGMSRASKTENTTISVVALGSNNAFPDIRSSKTHRFVPGIKGSVSMTFFHELVGHDGGREGTDMRSVQASNIFLRVNRRNFYRIDGGHKGARYPFGNIGLPGYPSLQRNLIQSIPSD